MSNLRTYLARYGVSSHEIALRGFFHPQYLIVNIDHESALWYAMTDWLREHKDCPPSLDLTDPMDRLAARAMILREHELAHFSAFLVNPFATTIQCLSFERDVQLIRLARTLRESGERRLRLPLKRWRENYSLSPAVASRVQQIEDQAHGCTAILGMLAFGLHGLSIPAALSNVPSNPKYWPWLLFCREIQNINMARGGLSFRDLHEGFAVISETRGLLHLGVSVDQYLELRQPLYGEYARVPALISNVLGGWYEVTAGIATAIACTFPAVAVLVDADDWPRFDASTCLVRVLEAMAQLGPALTYVKDGKPLDEYIKSVFHHSYPGFEPETLLQSESRKKIEVAFGIDKIRELDGLELMLPTLTWLERSQDQVNEASSREWSRRFMPFPLDSERWYPPIIWFLDQLGRYTDLETYTNLRMSFLNHLIADSIWCRRDLKDVERWCFGGLDGSDRKIDGAENVCAFLVEKTTGYPIDAVEDAGVE